MSNSSLKKDLKFIRTSINTISEIVTKYPNSNEYKELLARLQQEETDLVDKIGRK